MQSFTFKEIGGRTIVMNIGQIAEIAVDKDGTSIVRIAGLDLKHHLGEDNTEMLLNVVEDNNVESDDGLADLLRGVDGLSDRKLGRDRTPGGA